MTFLSPDARSPLSALDHHRRIIWALLLRELATRYGRENLGFLWVLGEPLLFCGSVSIMWSIIKPHYEHGIQIVPFVVTGYMPILLVRHTARNLAPPHCPRNAANETTRQAEFGVSQRTRG